MAFELVTAPDNVTRIKVIGGAVPPRHVQLLHGLEELQELLLAQAAVLREDQAPARLGVHRYMMLGRPRPRIYGRYKLW